jgi:hypothetical protein
LSPRPTAASSTSIRATSTISPTPACRRTTPRRRPYCPVGCSTSSGGSATSAGRARARVSALPNEAPRLLIVRGTTAGRIGGSGPDALSGVRVAGKGSMPASGGPRISWASS